MMLRSLNSFPHGCDVALWLILLDESILSGMNHVTALSEDVYRAVCWVSNPTRNPTLILRWKADHIYAFFLRVLHLRKVFWGLFLRGWGVIWQPFWTWRGWVELSILIAYFWARTFPQVAARDRFFPFRRVSWGFWMFWNLSIRGAITVAIIFSHKF